MSGFDYQDEHDADVIDPSLDNYILVTDFFYNNARFREELFVHKAAYQSKEFYRALIDHENYENVEILYKRMRNLGLEPYFE